MADRKDSRGVSSCTPSANANHLDRIHITPGICGAVKGARAERRTTNQEKKYNYMTRKLTTSSLSPAHRVPSLFPRICRTLLVTQATLCTANQIERKRSRGNRLWRPSKAFDECASSAFSWEISSRNFTNSINPTIQTPQTRFITSYVILQSCREASIRQCHTQGHGEGLRSKLMSSTLGQQPSLPANIGACWWRSSVRNLCKRVTSLPWERWYSA